MEEKNHTRKKSYKKKIMKKGSEKCCYNSCSKKVSKKHTQICSLTRLSCLKTVFTLKSIPTVETKAEVKESSAYRNKKEVFPTELFPMIKILNM